MTRRASPSLLAGCLLVAAFLSPSAPAAQAFLRIPGIPGDSIDATHPAWINLDSSSLTFQRPTTLKKGQRPNTWLAATKALDRATPLLLQSAAAGVVHPRVWIEYTRPLATTNLVYYQIILENVTLLGVQQSGSAPLTRESVSLGYTKVSWTYATVSSTGAISKTGTFWDLIGNVGGSFTDADLLLYGVQRQGEAASLVWPAATGQRFRVLGSPSVEGPYSILREITAESTGALEITLPFDGAAGFFHIQRLDAAP